MTSVNDFDGDTDTGNSGNDIPLDQAESLDSDEIRNNDGDDVVDPPERWIEAKDDETLDERLAEEVPDVTPDDIVLSDADATSSPGAGILDAGPADGLDEDGAVVLAPDDELDRIDPRRHGSDEVQIDGTPEDGESFFTVEE